MAHVKGVQFTSSSLNFPQINTRGFATIANTRFVQFVDGMDISAPLLNFPTGNIVGLGELDAESMELIPGASSALYGPNAFNGSLIMRSKSPFDYQGLSVQFKGGITTSDAQGKSYPMYNTSIRYAKAFNNKFAIKLNFSIMDAEDWHSNDYKTDVNRSDSKVDLTSTQNFDGVNTYGDDTQIVIPAASLPPGLGPLDLRRTGWKEENLVDNYDARSIKADGAIHYRPTDNLEILYNYRYGGGSSVYQGSQKYALRNFTQQFHKFEVRANNFFVRAYLTATDAGDSYNMAALGGIMNERISDTKAVWAPTYAQSYVLAMQGYVPGVTAGNTQQSHAFARSQADASRNAMTPQEIAALTESVRNDYFQRTPAGAKFIDNSRLYHAEFNYNFKNILDQTWDVQIGGNVRRYSLFSDGTIFNEAPDDGVNFKRINIDEYGTYTQISKTFAEALKLTGSVRYDKNMNFNGRVTPRVSAVYTFLTNHNIRVSFQTGFRNPDTQAQYIYFPVGTNTLLGSSKDNAQRYGVHEGGAWTRASYEDFTTHGGSVGPDGTVSGGDPAHPLVDDYVEYVKPEQLKAFEVGYKGLIGTNFLIDLNYYYTSYTNFLGGDDVVSKMPTTHQGKPVPAGTVFSPYRNSPEDVTSTGVGLGLTYTIHNYTVTGNYNYATFDASTGVGGTFRAAFNTPENKIQLGVGNRKLTRNLGFNVNFRWQEDFLWQSDFGDWIVPAFGVVDAQVSYKVASIKSILKLGANNIGGGDYRTNLGGPFVGQQYYLSITFDQFYR
jgi:outer membrane receptor protein involved in Fe transport